MRTIIKDIPNSIFALYTIISDDGKITSTTKITKTQADIITSLNNKTYYERQNADKEVT